MATPGVNGHRWRQLRTSILATATHCAICGKPLIPHAPPRSRWSSTVDHVVPRSKGGSHHDPRNLVPAHYGCNARKKDRTSTRRAGITALRM